MSYGASITGAVGYAALCLRPSISAAGSATVASPISSLISTWTELSRRMRYCTPTVCSEVAASSRRVRAAGGLLGLGQLQHLPDGGLQPRQSGGLGAGVRSSGMKKPSAPRSAPRKFEPKSRVAQPRTAPGNRGDEPRRECVSAMCPFHELAAEAAESVGA